MFIQRQVYRFAGIAVVNFTGQCGAILQVERDEAGAIKNCLDIQKKLTLELTLELFQSGFKKNTMVA